MKRFIALFAALLVLILTSGCARLTRAQTTSGPGVTPGVYKTHWVIPEPVIPEPHRPGFQGLEAGSVVCMLKPSEVPKEERPSTASKSAIYGRLVLSFAKDPAKGGLYFCLDTSMKSSGRYDTLYLEPEPAKGMLHVHPVTGVYSKRNFEYDYSIEFLPVAQAPFDALFPGAANHNTVALDVYVHIIRGLLPMIDFRVRGCWAGELQSSKGPIPFRLLDLNFNGLYSDQWNVFKKPPVSGDQVILDLRGRGGAVEYPGVYIEQLAASAPANILGSLVELKPSRSGEALEIAPYTGPRGYVAIKFGRIGAIEARTSDEPSARLWSFNQTYWMLTDGSLFEVPAGYYRTGGLQIPAGKDSDWRLNYATTRLIEVRAGATTNIPVEGKVRMDVKPTNDTITVTRSQCLNISIILRLSDGAYLSIYEDSGTARRGTIFMLPEITMVSASGKTAYRRTVDWGGGALVDSSALPDKIRPGRYKYNISYDTGPFGGVLKATKTIIVK